ncbi:DUF4190 domain-containing protein [Streptomyces sp. NBC_01264]|uniref:DUF4190 domain-containing protein n=1 Tax=Streptomyces sp. NBC_01264 TaxID=2903804 RepID=UPI0022546BE5|nr:DUF4190 domain-containing protein [Streptomyces sp. NBC_01264]MCX4780799.1 DUF4190 domain-containing protein [Streptomyces sp. NBC_01264]
MSTQPPYQWPAPPPQGYAYGPPPLNGFALASLLVGMLCFPPLGIVFGIVALTQIRKKGERGKVLAVLGLVVSVLLSGGLVLGAERAADTFFARARAMGAAEPYEDVEGELTDLDDLGAGSCFNVPGGDLLEENPFVYRIGCAQVHDAEVTLAHALGGSRFPGEEELKESAAQDCWRAQDAYAMDTWALPPYAEMFYFAPSRERWEGGDRLLVCVIGTAEQEQRGSLRKDAGVLAPEQVAFLQVMNAADLALGHAPDADVDEALEQYRAWAREMDGVLAAESRLLAGEKARPQLAGPAGAQREAVEAARREWRRASEAQTGDGFVKAWDRALAELPVATEKALRGAYGLSTTVPEWLEEPQGDASAGPSVEQASA